MYAWLLEACGGGASWGGSLDFSQAWRQRGWILGEHARRSESRSAGTVQLWEIRGRYEWKRAPHSDPSAQGWVHGFNHQSLCSLAWWKQLAHYTFIETQPFITFLPWLCPNEAPEQGLNVMTLLRLFLKGEIQDADDAVTLSNREGTLHTTLGMRAISTTASHVGCSVN